MNGMISLNGELLLTRLEASILNIISAYAIIMIYMIWRIAFGDWILSQEAPTMIIITVLGVFAYMLAHFKYKSEHDQLRNQKKYF